MKIPKYSAHVLDENFRVCGYYYLENGFWMSHGKPDYSKPVQRHRIVDDDGIHHDIAPDTIKQI